MLTPPLSFQVPGSPVRSLLSTSMASPDIDDFLVHESTVFLVLHGRLSPGNVVPRGLLASTGDPSKFSCKWCNDGGANRSIPTDITDFTSNYRSVNINITVAKQNIFMQAVGGGDCRVHCLDNMGRPASLSSPTSCMFRMLVAILCQHLHWLLKDTKLSSKN